MHAMARLLLHGRIDNIQCSWVKLGDEGTVAMLNGGCNDLGGTLMEETISRMAGSEHGSARTVAAAAGDRRGGRPARPRERTTTYGAVRSSLAVADGSGLRRPGASMPGRVTRRDAPGCVTGRRLRR